MSRSAHDVGARCVESCCDAIQARPTDFWPCRRPVLGAMFLGRNLIVGLAVAAVMAACGSSLAQAASPVSPTAQPPVTDTHTPTFIVQLDTSLQADGQPTDSSDVGITVFGSDGHGGTTTVAFCNATDLGGGRVGCSDPT